MGIRLTALTPAQVAEVIAHAEGMAAKVDGRKVTKPDELLNADSPLSGLQELVAVIDQLPPHAKTELMSLVWLGMGTIEDDPMSWAALLNAAQEEQVNDVPEELALMANLHEYLQRGLDKVS
jgi:hypothetical protein